MNIEESLHQRCESQCELCATKDNLLVYNLPPVTTADIDESVLICKTCHEQIEHADKIDIDHWRCLNESMWSQIPAVQVLAWRMLSRLDTESWAQDLLDMLYLDESTLKWAQAGIEETNMKDVLAHADCNGVTLHAGDNVQLIKDLNVKGTNFTAKRGTAVRGISLVADNPEHIEGRINGQRIVLLTRFVKKM